MDRQARRDQKDVEKLSTSQVFALMDFPLRAGISEAHVFIDKSLSTRVPESEIFDQLTYDYEDQSVFRKEQSCAAICILHERAADAAIKEKCRAFLERIEDGRLSLLNQVECAFLRVIRKISIISRHPALRDKEDWWEAAPELARFLGALSAPDASDDAELALHNLKFTELRSLTSEQLKKELAKTLKAEKAINDAFIAARAKSSRPESPAGGFEYYGLNGRHDAFRRIIRGFGIELGRTPKSK